MKLKTFEKIKMQDVFISKPHFMKIKYNLSTYIVVVDVKRCSVEEGREMGKSEMLKHKLLFF